jgi:hypothetical protein
VIYIYISNYNIDIIPVNWAVPLYMSIGLSALNLLLPMDELNKCINVKNDDQMTPEYSKL